MPPEVDKSHSWPLQSDAIEAEPISISTGVFAKICGIRKYWYNLDLTSVFASRVHEHPTTYLVHVILVTASPTIPL
jgi:hypothetical protein